jgi:hypothetical protein
VNWSTDALHSGSPFYRARLPRVLDVVGELFIWNKDGTIWYKLKRPVFARTVLLKPQLVIEFKLSCFYILFYQVRIAIRFRPSVSLSTDSALLLLLGTLTIFLTV